MICHWDLDLTMTEWLIRNSVEITMSLRWAIVAGT